MVDKDLLDLWDDRSRGVLLTEKAISVVARDITRQLLVYARGVCISMEGASSNLRSRLTWLIGSLLIKLSNLFS